MSGDCDVEGDCVSSANHPDNHGNNEECDITMLRDAVLTPHNVFNLEAGWDHLTILGVSITSSDQVPHTLNAGTTFTWASDGSVNNEGWEICFSEYRIFSIYRRPFPC